MNNSYQLGYPVLLLVLWKMEKTLKTIIDISKTFKFFHSSSVLQWNIPRQPQLDEDYLCDPQHTEFIEQNITSRKGVGNIKLVSELKQKLEHSNKGSTSYDDVRKKFYDELYRIPNRTHPEVFKYGEQPKLVKLVNEKRELKFKPKEFQEITKKLNVARTDHLGNVCGNRSYYIMGEMAELEQALVNFFVSRLLKNGFELISVPDILPKDVIESCGMNTTGERDQVNLVQKLLVMKLCIDVYV